MSSLKTILDAKADEQRGVKFDRWGLEQLKPVDVVIDGLVSVQAHFLLKVIAERAMSALWELDTEMARKMLRHLTDAAIANERNRPADLVAPVPQCLAQQFPTPSAIDRQKRGRSIGVGICDFCGNGDVEVYAFDSDGPRTKIAGLAVCGACIGGADAQSRQQSETARRCDEHAKDEDAGERMTGDRFDGQE